MLLVDISNLLFCIAQLLPSICERAEDLLGLSINSKTKILRDIHVKCQELLNCFIIRGASLEILQKIFRKGLDNMEMFKSKNTGPALWVMLSLPNIFKNYPKNIQAMSDLPPDIYIALDLMVLLAQPQPNWSLLLKVLKKTNFYKTITRLGFRDETFQSVKTYSRNIFNKLYGRNAKTCF